MESANQSEMVFGDVSRDASSSTKTGDRSMMDRTFNISGYGDDGKGNATHRPTGPGEDVIEDL